MRSWVEWHEDYDRAGSSLSHRLGVVQRRLRVAVDSVGAGSTVLSLCSGDGRDVIGVLSAGAAGVKRAVLIERDAVLADRARRSAADRGLAEVEVRVGDAGTLRSFVDVVPADVLMLCGIFGNIGHACVREIVDCIPGLVRPGGYVVWTRGGSDPDRRSEIRGWFVEAGAEEVAFDGAPESYGVGLNRLADRHAGSPSLPDRLFEFS